MAGIKYFPDNLDIKNKTIILRLDLNVPLKNKNIQDFTRINIIIPFLKSLIMKKAKIIIITHLGRPEGTRNSEFSLIPIYKYLKKKISSNIYFYMGNINQETKTKTSYLKPGEIILFDNIRFFKEESTNNESF